MATNTTFEEYFEYEVAEDPRVTKTLWVGGILGTMGCILNILVFLTFNKTDKKTASIILYQTLAVFDFVATFVDGTLEMLLNAVTGGFNIANIGGRVYCKLFRYLDGFSNAIAFYLVVSILVDRCAAVRYPHWYRDHSSVKHGLTYAAIVVAIGMVLESPTAFFTEIRDGMCGLIPRTLTDRQFSIYLYVYRCSFVYLLLPLSCIVCFSTLLITSLKNRKVQNDNKGDDKSTNQPRTRRENFEQGQKRMVILLTTSFILLITPSISLFMIDFGEQQTTSLVYNVAEIGLILQHSINLLLYLSSGPAFRASFIRAMHL